MQNNYKVGDVVTGVVTGIQPYGAFVELDSTTQGLIHISQVTYGFVKDINDFFLVGDLITVKILNIDCTEQKISLSLRALQEEPNLKKRIHTQKTLQACVEEEDAEGFQALKNKLQEWIQQSGQ